MLYFSVLETSQILLVDGFVPTPTLGLISGRGTVDHWEITEQGCLHTAQEALFDEGLITTRLSANDLEASTLVELAFGDGASASDFLEAMEEIEEANSDVDNDLPLISAAHMDAENFVDGNERLLTLRSVVINEILKEEFVGARVAAGQLFHTLQDFYSHSNWVELGHRTPHADLAKVGRVPGNIAPPNVPTCSDCFETLLGTKRYVVTCRNNLLTGTDRPQYLTSGYYTSQKLFVVGPNEYQDRRKPEGSTLQREASNEGKCSHGGSLDISREDTATGGINKDATSVVASPHWYLHKDAADVAVQATADFLEDIRHEVGNALFIRFLGLDYGASLSFAIDTTESMRDDIEDVSAAVNKIIDSRLAGGSVPSQYVLTEFNDPEVGPVHSTSDPEEFKRIVAGVTVRPGNNDKAELAIGGLLLALKNSRPRSTVYLFTDGDAKDWERYQEALTLIYNRKITVYVIRSDRGMTNGAEAMNSSVYTLIAVKSGGQVFFGNKTEVGRLLEITASMTSSSDVTLLTIDSSTPAMPPLGHNWTLLVDSSVHTMTVSASGINPSIYLFDQNDIRVTGLSFQLASVALGQWSRPTAGRMTVQVMAESSYTLRVNALSSLDLQYRFVVFERKEHFGYFPVRGIPRAGDSVNISLTVVGLTSDQTVDRVFLQMENGTIIDTVVVEKLNDTKNRFITTDAITVPEVSFYVGLEGTEISTGASFKRMDVTVVTPTKFRIVLQPDSQVVFKQGTTSTVGFIVENGRDAPPDEFSFNITDELNLYLVKSPSIFSLKSYQNLTVEVMFEVPPCYGFTGTNRVTVIVNSQTSDVFASLVIETFIDSEYVDIEAPVCILQSVSNCLVPDTCNATWRAAWYVLDRISPIQEIKPLPSFNTTIVRYDRTRNNASNQWISVTADISCCDNGTILTVTDVSGNKANCSVTRKSKAPNCRIACQNGGKCKEGNSCACLGGYFGDLCNNGKNQMRTTRYIQKLSFQLDVLVLLSLVTAVQRSR
jgi:hypothetical protein